MEAANPAFKEDLGIAEGGPRDWYLVTRPPNTPMTPS